MKKINLKEGLEDNGAIDLELTSKQIGELDPQTAKELADAKKKKIINLKIKGNKGLFAEEDDVLEPEAVITPQDRATIKYLSNVVDNKTGEISQPFTIGAQKYQMVRGMGADKQIVLAVFAHDETDDNGENIIHSIEEFEKNIAIPMREKLELESMGEPSLQGADIQTTPDVQETKKETTYEGSRHFFVNEKTKGIRSFKSIKEMLECGKSDEEKYMGLSEFKKHMNEVMFGKRKKINELGDEPVDAAAQPADASAQGGNNSNIPQEINNQHILPQVNIAIEQMIKRVKPYMNKIDDDKKKVQFIAALVEMLHISDEWKGKLATSIKSVFKQAAPVAAPPMGESKVITKNQLMESLNTKKVIKTIKVKDIK